MWTTITTAWSKAKYRVIGGGLAILYLLDYQKGKHKASKNNERNLRKCSKS